MLERISKTGTFVSTNEVSGLVERYAKTFFLTVEHGLWNSC